MNTSEIEKVFKSIGIKNSSYATDGRFNFRLNTKRNKLLIDVPVINNIKIYPDKKHKQAVVVFKESNEIITEYLDIHLSNKDHEVAEKLINERRAFRINSSYKIKNYSYTCNIHYQNKHTHSFTLEVTINSQNTCFLMGYDEKHLFISALPFVVKSVEAAHKILKPKGLKSTAIRMGEWFFNPLTNIELNKIKHELNINNSDVDLEDMDGSFYHLGPKNDRKVYAIGIISHAEDRHKSIFLPTFHEVIRNNEIEFDGDNWD